jgi:hypothetical protein
MTESPPPGRDWRDDRGVFVLFLFAGLWLIAIAAMFWGSARHKVIPPDIAMLGWGIVVIAAGVGIEVRRRRRAATSPPPHHDDA